MTSIEWTNETWNPVRGCSMAAGSETGGCLNCYAARYAARGLPAQLSPTTGKPYAVHRSSGPRWTGEVELIPAMLDRPLRWKRPRRIFVNSMSDLFHEKVSNNDIDRVFEVMAQSPRHTFQILTKRARRMRHWANRYRSGNPLPNVWLGVSVENQTTTNDRVWDLVLTKAARRFVSYEPALGSVSFVDGPRQPESTVGPWSMLDDVDQVIVGGESGPGARPFDVAWARTIIAECRDTDTAVFVKQLGAHPYERIGSGNHGGDYGEEINDLRFAHRKGADMDEWPEDLRVREYPE